MCAKLTVQMCHYTGLLRLKIIATDSKTSVVKRNDYGKIK